MTENEETELTALYTDKDDATERSEGAKKRNVDDDVSEDAVGYKEYQGPETRPSMFIRRKDISEKSKWLHRVFRIQSLSFIQSKTNHGTLAIPQ